MTFFREKTKKAAVGGLFGVDLLGMILLPSLYGDYFSFNTMARLVAAQARHDNMAVMVDMWLR